MIFSPPQLFAAFGITRFGMCSSELVVADCALHSPALLSAVWFLYRTNAY